jgi:hypothetical protein
VILKVYVLKGEADHVTDCLTLLIQQSKIEYFDNKLKSKNIRICKLIYNFLVQEFSRLPKDAVIKSFIFLKNLFCIFKNIFSSKNVQVHNE